MEIPVSSRDPQIGNEWRREVRAAKD